MKMIGAAHPEGRRRTGRGGSWGPSSSGRRAGRRRSASQGRRLALMRSAVPQSSASRGRNGSPGRGGRRPVAGTVAGRGARSTTRSCSPRATGATSWTVTATGATRRSSPTSTPAGTPSTWRSRTGSTTSTSARWSAPPTRSWPRRSTSSAAGAGTGAAPWSPTATSTSGTTTTVAAWSSWAPRARPAAARHRQPARVASRWRRYELPRPCVLVFGQEGPGPRPSRRGRPAMATLLDRPVRLDPVDQRRCRGRIAMHAWVRQHAVQPGRDAGWTTAERPVRPASPAEQRPVGRSPERGRLWQGRLQRDGTLGRTAAPPSIEHEETAMPIATPEVYAEMLDRAKAAPSPTRPST